MSARKALFIVLAGSALIELALACGGFLARERMIEGFRLKYGAETDFLGFVVAWFLLIVGIVCAIAAKLVRRAQSSGLELAFWLGLWWIAVGIGLAACFGRPEHLVADAAKGALIVALTLAVRRNSAVE